MSSLVKNKHTLRADSRGGHCAIRAKMRPRTHIFKGSAPAVTRKKNNERATNLPMRAFLLLLNVLSHSWAVCYNTALRMYEYQTIF